MIRFSIAGRLALPPIGWQPYRVPRSRCRLPPPVFPALALAVLLGGTALADERVGINSAVNPHGTGTPPTGPTRRLVIGQEVVFKARVATEAEGQTQILFLDESAMSVGPRSDLLIDEFVYDPHANTGKLVMSATRGVFRFVGGKVSKLEGAVTVRTPIATIGIRGGAFLLRVEGNSVDVVFIYGKSLTISGRNGCEQQTLYRPGYEVTIRGECPSSPGKAPTEFISELLTELDGRAGGNGGAQVIPTDRSVAVSGIGNVVSGNLRASVAAALKQAGRSCDSIGGLQAVAGRLIARCTAPHDPGNI
jgi:trimeric autotransporter adhesin